MKKIFVFPLIFIMLFCGCTAKSKPNTNQNGPKIEIDLNSDFSYKKDLDTFSKGQPGVKTDGFVCTTTSPIQTPKQAIELAKKEATVEYDTIHVEYDGSAEIYKVCFWKENYFGGDQCVYINQNGITLYIVYGE